MSSKWDDYFIDVAHRTAELSYATRLKVGAVAVRDKRIVACGYNGTPEGLSNVCEEVDDKGVLITLPTVIHAEANLFKYSYTNRIALHSCTLYVTHAPCRNCALDILVEGIQEVVYSTSYRSLEGLELLQETSKVKVRQYIKGHKND